MSTANAGALRRLDERGGAGLEFRRVLDGPRSCSLGGAPAAVVVVELEDAFHAHSGDQLRPAATAILDDRGADGR